MRYALALAVVLPLASATSPLCPSLRAQQPGDSLPRDTECWQGPHSPILLVAAVLAVAPPLLLPVAECLSAGPVPLGFRETHVAASVTGGPAFAYSPGPTWAHSENIESFEDGIYVELRIENLYLPEVIRYKTVRAGYLVSPVPGLASGVTLGYRFGHGLGAREGAEIGLPWITRMYQGWIRFEPTYVFGRHGADWSYRLQGEYPIRSGPVFAGFNIEAKALPLRHGGRVGSVSPVVLLGVRY